MKNKNLNFYYLGYRFLGNCTKYFPFSNSVQKSLNVASLRISHVVYVSSMIFWALIGMMLTAIISFPLTYFLALLNILMPIHIGSLQIPWYIYSVGATLGAGAVIIMSFLYYPYYIAGKIKTSLDKNIVYIINYMSILAGAGVTTENIFSSLAEKGEIYKVQDSAKAIVRDIDVLGKDILSAIDNKSMNTPSRKFSKLLLGINGISRTGGNLPSFLRETANRQMSIRRRELSKLVSSLNLAAEGYVVLGIAFPVILTTLLSMMGVFGGNVLAGLNPTQVMSLMTYIFFPLSAIAIILLIDGMTSSW